MIFRCNVVSILKSGGIYISIYINITVYMNTHAHIYYRRIRHAYFVNVNRSKQKWKDESKTT